jgi:hypothetical protein
LDPLEGHLHKQIDHSRDFFWHRVRWRAVARELDGDSFELTDVGAGIGLLGDFLARDFPRAEYRFVEPIETLERKLEERFGPAANAREADDYRASRYVALLDVLEHQEDDHAFLRELVSKMAPKATLVVTVPAMPRLWSQWDVALGHFRRYDRASLVAAFEGTPVELREVSYLFPEMLLPAAVRRLSTLVGGGRHPIEVTRAEFPNLPRPLNQLLYVLASATERLRRTWPAGTSLIAVARRRA